MSKRPILKISLGKSDKFLEFFTLLILLATWAYVYLAYSSLPEIIPTHFDLSGRPDDIGHKSGLWTLPLCSTIIYLFMTLVNRYPHIFNYLEEITHENAERQYRMGTRMIRVLKLMVVITFAVIVYASIDVDEKSKLIAFLPLLCILVSLVPVLTFGLSQNRAKK